MTYKRGALPFHRAGEPPSPLSNGVWGGGDPVIQAWKLPTSPELPGKKSSSSAGEVSRRGGDPDGEGEKPGHPSVHPRPWLCPRQPGTAPHTTPGKRKRSTGPAGAQQSGDEVSPPGLARAAAS